MGPTVFEASTKFRVERVLAAWHAIAGDGNDDLVDAKSARTIVQYASAWRVYLEWCASQGRVPMPATAQQLRDYLRYLSTEVRSAATQDSYLAAIATVHRLHGYRLDRTILIEPLKAARRRAGPQRRARALTRRVLKNLVGQLEAAIARDARDATLMLMGFAGALRSAEIVGLDWLMPGSRLQGGTGFVSLEPDGLLITLNTSKSSQVTPVSLVIRDVDMPSLRFWLNHWLTQAGVKPGEPLFRRVTKAQRVMTARLSPESIGRVIRARTFAYAKSQGKTDTEAYRLAREHSGHSLRRGYCTSASELQLTLGQIRARSRHASDAQLGKYIRSAEVWRHGAGLAKVGF